MYKIRSNVITTLDVANYLNKSTEFGENYSIHCPSSFLLQCEGSIAYTEACTFEELSTIKEKSLILTRPVNFIDVDLESIIPELIFTEEPEKDFYLIIKEFFIEDDIFEIDQSVIIDESTKLGVNVNIGEGSKIGKNVTIGNNTYIGKNVIINNDVDIGSGCYLKDSSIIGSDSFKFISEDNKSSYIPFIGKLIIENDVWIGSKVIIEKPALGKCFIKSDVKIDDLVQIGSDTIIHSHTQVAAGSIIGRDVSVGSNCSLGINTVVKPNTTISNNVITGIGAVVIKNLEKNNVYVGNPARELNK